MHQKWTEISYCTPEVDSPSEWPADGFSRLRVLSFVCVCVLPSLAFQWDPIHTPVMGSLFWVSPSTILPPPCTSKPCHSPTSPIIVCWVGTSLYLTWRRWSQGHTFGRDWPGCSSIVASSTSPVRPPCHHWHRRIPGNSQWSLPTCHGPTSGPPPSWPARFWWNYPPPRWIALVILGLPCHKGYNAGRPSITNAIQRGGG